MRSEADVRHLIDAGEQFDVEFRGEEGEALADRALVELVVCFANGRGGLILVGVEDDGRVTGARPRHGSHTDVRRVEALIGNQTVPSCPAECSVVMVEGREVLVIEVPPGRPVTSTADGVYRRRATNLHGRPGCLPFLASEIHSREADRGVLDYSALVLPEARWEDLDPLEFERLRQTIERSRGRADASLLELSDQEIVRTLGLGEGSGGRVERLRVAALLLVGREAAIRRFLPTHEVAFQVLSGTRVAANDFFRWPLVRIADEIARRFEARNEEEEIAVGPVRVGVPRYSPAGFREAVHNALIHRDYARLGAVHVQWREAEVEITSPGGLVDHVRLDNLLVAAPTPRNPVLADAFKRIGLVERTGRGIDTIYEGQLRYGREAPDYSRSTPGTVHVVLAGGAPNLAVARFIAERDVPGRRFTVDELLVLNRVERERRIDTEEAAELVQRSAVGAATVLDRLVERGILELRSERGALRSYQLSAGAARALGAGADAPQPAGAEPLDREQLVMQYVDANGRITRSQAAELCQLDPREARQILERLVKRGELVVRGEKRGSYYERSAEVMSGVQKL
jgi:ATP-dependent DNA helicase RecG